MFLIRQIKASGIAEVVIALAVIAMCFTVASLVFIRANSSPMKFQDVKIQTEIQSLLLQQLFLQEEIPEDIDLQLMIEDDLGNDSLRVLIFTGSDNRVLWKQQWTKLFHQ